jgi:hypothetical protein
MPMALSLDAYKTELELLQRALEAPRGLRISCPDPIRQRALLYYARAAERKHNKKIFPQDNAMHGRSYFDNLVIRLVPDPKSPTGIEILKENPIPMEIEEL